MSEKQYDFTKTSNIKLYVYNEVYKKEWYRAHGISEEQIKAKMAEYEKDCENDEFEGSFEDFELEYGYNRGEIYVCFDEFLDNDINDYKDLIKELKQTKSRKQDSNVSKPEKRSTLASRIKSAEYERDNICASNSHQVTQKPPEPKRD